eukprot:4025579-Alexandrium_andersonii.AAC.1
MVLTLVALPRGAADFADALEGRGASHPAQDELRAVATSASRTEAPPDEAAAGRRRVRRDVAAEEPGVLSVMERVAAGPTLKP